MFVQLPFQVVDLTQVAQMVMGVLVNVQGGPEFVRLLSRSMLDEGLRGSVNTCEQRYELHGIDHRLS